MYIFFVFFKNSLIPNGGQKLKYHIHIGYEYSIPTRTQHHSLLIWRTIRTLEQQLNTQRTLIDAANKIDIATANVGFYYIYIMILVIYKFHIKYT